MNATASSIARACSSNAGARQKSSANDEALARLRDAMLGCCRCEALVRCRSRVVPGDGRVPAAVMFVGIAPGRFGGDITGIPFSGDRSGNLLRRMIARSGLEDVFITNLVRCNPRDERGRNRDPLSDEIANCRAHLEAEIAMVRPRIIACLGRIAWKHFAGTDAPFEPLGKSIERGGVVLYPMYHPGYVIRGAYSERRYGRDFRRLARFIERPVRITNRQAACQIPEMPRSRVGPDEED